MRAADLFAVSGRTVLVTGAASGLGRAISAVLAENGATVAMLDRDEQAVIDACTAIRDAGKCAAGGDVAPYVADVTDRASLMSAFSQVMRDHERLDVVFANAGVSVGPGFVAEPGRLENVTPRDWHRVTSTNLDGVFWTLQAAAPIMKRQRTGSIVVTCSVAGLRAAPIIGYAYVASKAAAVNLVRQAALELAESGVRVNGIAPGPFVTQIGNGRLHTEEFGQLFAAQTALGRTAQPEEIEGLALLLASDASRFITGSILSIDGGWIVK